MFYKNIKFNKKCKKALLFIVCVTLYAQDVFSDSSISDEEIITEELVVTGTRSKSRSVTETTAAVDVISSEEILAQGGSNMNDLLRTSLPSFNVKTEPGSDASSAIRPVNLRGLAPDHTLVLINGKRRHRSPVINWIGQGINDGSQGQDISPIPGLAIKSIEVLRDGAAAQYGSDAIAGVINFQLKEDKEGGAIELRGGEYSEGDGESLYLSGNLGLPVGGNGFINLTAEYGNQNLFNRGKPNNFGGEELLEEGFVVDETPQSFGQPKIDDDIKTFVNFGYDISERLNVYGHGNFASKTVNTKMLYRSPALGVANQGTYTNNGNILVGDLTQDFTGNCNQTLDITSATAQTTRDLNNENCFSVHAIYPNGFQGNLESQVNDASLVVGFNGKANEIDWDFSLNLGRENVEFTIGNTLNPSLGLLSPREFYAGKLEENDTAINLDFGYQADEKTFIAWGAEYRNEGYRIERGSISSYEAGPLAEQGFNVGTVGFQGFSEQVEVDADRSNVAMYLDTEIELSNSVLFSGAIRWEDFEGFGDIATYKAGLNWRVTDSFGVRSTTSTGFKAPTAGQLKAFNATTFFDNGNLLNRGTIPIEEPIAQFYGASELTPEKSKSKTAGIFLSAGPIDITVDYFTIEIEDRITLSENFTLSESEQEMFDTTFSVINFFTNDYSSKTSGFDVVMTSVTDSAFGTTRWNLSFSDIDTEITDGTLSESRVRLIEDGVPDIRWNFTVNHEKDNFRFLVRTNHFGQSYDRIPGEYIDTNTLFDFEIGYKLFDRAEVVIGAQNFTDEYPELDEPIVLGLTNDYAINSPYGFGGAFWYSRIRFDF